MALISLLRRFLIKASMVLMRAKHLFIQNYIISLFNIILRPIFKVRVGLEFATYSSILLIYILYLIDYKVRE